VDDNRFYVSDFSRLLAKPTGQSTQGRPSPLVVTAALASVIVLWVLYYALGINHSVWLQ